MRSFCLRFLPCCAFFVWWLPMGQAAGKEFGSEARRVLSDTGGRKSTGAALDTATFAAGCFWGVELAFQRVAGVSRTRVGYTKGRVRNPTYEQVCGGSTGHTEAVQVSFDPSLVSYSELLTVLWDRMDPTTRNRQGNDAGTQYRSGIYYHSVDQQRAAEASIAKEQQRYDRPIVTELLAAEEFWPAEEHHQQYLSKGGQCSRKGDNSAIQCVREPSAARAGRRASAPPRVGAPHVLRRSEHACCQRPHSFSLPPLSLQYG